MCVGPSFPWVNFLSGGIAEEGVAANDNGAEATETSETHKADVSMVGEVGVRQELVVLLAAFVECHDTHN